MNEEEKEDIELDIEAKYVDRTEKEFLSRVTYAECLYILTPENKYCGKIRELAVLKLCEIIDRLQKENEELKEYKKIAELTKISCCTAQNCEALNNAIKGELENQKLKEELNDINQKWIQKVKDKIEELKEQDREWTEELSEPDSNFKDIDRNLKRIKNQIDVLQKLLEGRE